MRDASVVWSPHRLIFSVPLEVFAGLPLTQRRSDTMSPPNMIFKKIQTCHPVWLAVVFPVASFKSWWLSEISNGMLGCNTRLNSNGVLEWRTPDARKVSHFESATLINSSQVSRPDILSEIGRSRLDEREGQKWHQSGISYIKQRAICCEIQHLLVGNGHLHINTWLDANVSDLSHFISRGVQIDDTLVDSHLESIPSVGTLTTRRFAGGQSQNLGWHADRTANFQVLANSTIFELSTNLFDSLNLTQEVNKRMKV